MTIPTSCIFIKYNIFIIILYFCFQCFKMFMIFSAQPKGVAGKMYIFLKKGGEQERVVGRADGRTQPPSASRAAERAATSARPEGPSEESCRNRCRREERMLRAKRASSPDKLGLLDAALTSEQRSSTEQGVEQLICKAVLKQKRPRAAAKQGHSQNACHSESLTISDLFIKQYKQLCFKRSFERFGCTDLRE